MSITRLVAPFLLLLCVSIASAEETTFVITPDSRPRGLDLAPKERVVEDATAMMTLDMVRALGPEKFVPVEKLGKLNLESAYWAKVDVKSELPLDMQYLANAVWWDFFDIFVLRADGSVTTLHSGLLKTPADANDRFYPMFFVRSGETLTLFVRFKSTGMFHLPESPVIYLSQAASRLERDRPFDYFNAIVVGMLFALALYNFIIALSTRDAAYFLYSLYLLALSISLMGQMGGNASKINQYLLPDHPWVAMWLKRLSDPLAWILLVLFDRAFLETRRQLPAWDKLFIALGILVALEALVFLLGWRSDRGSYEWILDTPYHILVVAGIAAGVVRYRQGFVPAKYFVIAQALLSLGMLAMLHRDSSWYPLNYLPSGTFWSYLRGEPLWIAAAAEAILFSMGLAYRMNMLKEAVAKQTLAAEQERRRLAVEHQAQLEVEVAERTRELREEKERATHLLHNILPVEVADELIASGSTQPQRYEEVSILFTDFRGFTSTVASLPAKKVIEELNDIFHHFDDIIDACGIEKIKTIGDSYMIAGGLPRPLPDHAERCVEAALKMQAYLDERNKSSAVKWSMRAGIHSGAVVAGVVGKRKFTYDVWGDTVNIASRMESACEPGRVNVSAYTYDLIKSRYKGEYRGKLDAKGKGEIDMYFVVP